MLVFSGSRPATILSGFTCKAPVAAVTAPMTLVRYATLDSLSLKLPESMSKSVSTSDDGKPCHATACGALRSLRVRAYGPLGPALWQRSAPMPTLTVTRLTSETMSWRKRNGGFLSSASVNLGCRAAPRQAQTQMQAERGWSVPAARPCKRGRTTRAKMPLPSSTGRAGVARSKRPPHPGGAASCRAAGPSPRRCSAAVDCRCCPAAAPRLLATRPWHGSVRECLRTAARAVHRPSE